MHTYFPLGRTQLCLQRSSITLRDNSSNMFTTFYHVLPTLALNLLTLLLQVKDRQTSRDVIAQHHLERLLERTLWQETMFQSIRHPTLTVFDVQTTCKTTSYSPVELANCPHTTHFSLLILAVSITAMTDATIV